YLDVASRSRVSTDASLMTSSEERRPAPCDVSARSARAAGAAFEALVATHYADLCDFVFRFVKSRDAAEDIVQDVFVRLWERRAESDPRDPRPYLYRAARNGALSYLRHRHVHERWQADALAAE